MGVRHEGVPEESIMAPCSLEHCSKHDRFIQSFICLFRESSDHNTFDRAHSTMIASNTHTHIRSLLRTFTSLLSLLFVHSLFIHSYIRCALACFVGYPSCFATARRRTKKSVEFQSKRKPICLTKHSPQEYYTTRARRELDSRILGNLRSQLCVASHTQNPYHYICNIL